MKDPKGYFPVKKGIFKKTVDHVKAMDWISFDLFRGKTLERPQSPRLWYDMWMPTGVR